MSFVCELQELFSMCMQSNIAPTGTKCGADSTAAIVGVTVAGTVMTTLIIGVVTVIVISLR